MSSERLLPYNLDLLQEPLSITDLSSPCSSSEVSSTKGKRFLKRRATDHTSVSLRRLRMLTHEIYLLITKIKSSLPFNNSSMYELHFPEDDDPTRRSSLDDKLIPAFQMYAKSDNSIYRFFKRKGSDETNNKTNNSNAILNKKNRVLYPEEEEDVRLLTKLYRKLMSILSIKSEGKFDEKYKTCDKYEKTRAALSKYESSDLSYKEMERLDRLLRKQRREEVDQPDCSL